MISEQLAKIDSYIKNVMTQIAEAAKNSDLAAIQRLDRKATELHQLKTQVAAIEERLKVLATDDTSRAPTADKPFSNSELRKLPIEVTHGDVRQNLLKLTPHIKSGQIKIGEELDIQALPSGERFRTFVSDKGNKLRARREVARFYKHAKIQPGDFVLLTEETPGRWTLKKAAPGEYSRYK